MSENREQAGRSLIESAVAALQAGSIVEAVVPGVDGMVRVVKAQHYNRVATIEGQHRTYKVALAALSVISIQEPMNLDITDLGLSELS